VNFVEMILERSFQVEQFSTHSTRIGLSFLDMLLFEMSCSIFKVRKSFQALQATDKATVELCKSRHLRCFVRLVLKSQFKQEFAIIVFSISSEGRPIKIPTCSDWDFERYSRYNFEYCSCSKEIECIQSRRIKHSRN